MAISQQTMTHEQRKSVALEYLPDDAARPRVCRSSTGSPPAPVFSPVDDQTPITSARSPVCNDPVVTLRSSFPFMATKPVSASRTPARP